MKPCSLPILCVVLLFALVLGLSTSANSQPRLQAGSGHGLDSLRLDGMPPRLPVDVLTHNALEKRDGTLPNKVLSPQSQIYVIDTAIVRSIRDTTRHLYSFNASARWTADVRQKLEGDLWVNSSRETSTYDVNNNMLTHLEEDWSNGKWVNYWRLTSTYDAHNKLLTYLSEGWSNGQWVNFVRESYTYDANINMLTWLSEKWSNGEWVNSARETNTYDASNNLLTHLTEQWLTGQWVSVWRETYSYDPGNHMLTSILEGCPSGHWENFWRNTYTYDAKGNMLSMLGEDCMNGQWTNSSRETYTYDGNNNLLTHLSEGWSNGQWMKSWRYTWTFDEKGNTLSIVMELGSNGQLMNSWRVTYTYDANNNRLTYLSEDWSNGQWGDSERRTWAYDSHGILTSFWHYSWTNSSWSPSNIDGLSVSDSAGNYYFLGSGYNFTLTNKLIVTGIAFDGGSVPGAFTLSQNYPNPFNPETTIKYELPRSSTVKLSVYDILGREVSVLVNERKNAGVHEVKFDAAGLSSGVYFYRLEVHSVLRSAEDESLGLRDPRRQDPLDSTIGPALPADKRDSKSGAGDFLSTKKMLVLK